MSGRLCGYRLWMHILAVTQLSMVLSYGGHRYKNKFSYEIRWTQADHTFPEYYDEVPGTSFSPSFGSTFRFQSVKHGCVLGTTGHRWAEIHGNVTAKVATKFNRWCIRESTGSQKPGTFVLLDTRNMHLSLSDDPHFDPNGPLYTWQTSAKHSRSWEIQENVWDIGWHLIDATSDMVISVHEGCELYALHKTLLNRHVDSWDFHDVKYADYGDDHGPSNDRKYEFRHPEPPKDDSAGDSTDTESEKNSEEDDSSDQEEQSSRRTPDMAREEMIENLRRGNINMKDILKNMQF